MDSSTKTITNSQGRQKLREYLKECEITAHELAQNAGIDTATISRILSGERKTITVDTAFKIELATDGEIAMNDWCVKASAQ